MEDMSNSNNRFFQELQRELKEIRRSAGNRIGQGLVGVRNAVRQLRQPEIDYVVLTVGGALPERDLPPRNFIQRQLPLPTPPLSVQTLNRRLQRIAEADNVKGVLLILQELSVGLATLQSLRRAIERTRTANKEVIVYTPMLDLPHYYLASSANQIIAPPSAQFDLLGLHSSQLFLKDSLARAGIQLEIIKISPYKSAYDQFGESEMSPQLREMVSWLLDEQFKQIVAGIAEGRKLSKEEVQKLIDSAPIYGDDLQDTALVDHVGYEHDLPTILGENEGKAMLKRWGEAVGLLKEKYRPMASKWVGVVSLEGTIMMGSSRQPPVDLPIPLIGGAVAGEKTIIQLFRKLAKMEQIAGILFYVNSPGGSALASDLMKQQAQLVGEKIPILAYMGDVAASGGYYVSAPAKKIICQPGTVTGSIGVIMGRPNSTGLLDKISAQQETVQRGARAGLYSKNAPLTVEERQLLQEGIENSYKLFKQVVADGRDLPYESLDEICEGRVWMGSQALAHGLVDGQGDFVDAIQQLAEMAELPATTHRIPTVNIFPKDEGYLLPAIPSASKELIRLISGEQIRELFNGQPLALMPYDFKLW